LSRVGEAMAPALIRKVSSFAHLDKVTIIDAPMGTRCPVIAPWVVRAQRSDKSGKK